MNHFYKIYKIKIKKRTKKKIFKIINQLKGFKYMFSNKKNVLFLL